MATTNIIIRKNVRGPQRYKYVLRSNNRTVVESKQYRSRGSAISGARVFISIIKRGVSFHE